MNNSDPGMISGDLRGGGGDQEDQEYQDDQGQDDQGQDDQSD